MCLFPRIIFFYLQNKKSTLSWEFLAPVVLGMFSKLSHNIWVIKKGFEFIRIFASFLVALLQIPPSLFSSVLDSDPALQVNPKSDPTLNLGKLCNLLILSVFYRTATRLIKHFQNFSKVSETIFEFSGSESGLDKTFQIRPDPAHNSAVPCNLSFISSSLSL